MSKPTILAVDDDPQVSARVAATCAAATASDYRVVGATSGAEALDGPRAADAPRPAGGAVPVGPADALDDRRSSSWRRRGRRPRTPKRVLLTAYADTDVAITAINRVGLDYYLLKPWDPPQERLFPVLDDLRRTGWPPTGPPTTGSASPATGVPRHPRRPGLLRPQRPALPLAQRRAGPRGADLIAAQPATARSPSCSSRTAGAARPDRHPARRRLGLPTTAARPLYDFVIVGAGPAGLAAGVYSASEGLCTCWSSARPGRPGRDHRLDRELPRLPLGPLGRRPDPPGRHQASRFGAEILRPGGGGSLTRDDPAKILTLADGTEISAETVLLATGVSYNRLDAPGADRSRGRASTTAPRPRRAGLHPQHVFIVGGANSAGQAAVHFAKYAARVTILVRADSLDASMSRYLIDEIDRTPNIEVGCAHGGPAGRRRTTSNADAPRRATAATPRSRPASCSPSSAPGRTPTGSRASSSATSTASS